MSSPLEGTIKTPLGTVQKKTAALVGGGIVLIGVIVWYRQKQMDTSTPTTDAEINPATGYPYGSPEDAAALAAQNGYVSPPANSGGGSSAMPPSNLGYSSNGQWSQATIEVMTSNGSVSDPSALSSALGKYIVGAYVASGSGDESLIQQAIAVNGYPPVSGPTGYPPSINRTPPTVVTDPPPASNPTTRKPTPKGPRGYGWVQAIKDGESLQSLANRSGTPLDNLTKYNSAASFNRVVKGEWFRTRYDSNPTSGYKGK